MFYSQHSFLVNVRFRSGLVKKSGVKFTKVIILFFGPHYLYFFLVGSPNDQLLNIHSLLPAPQARSYASIPIQ